MLAYILIAFHHIELVFATLAYRIIYQSGFSIKCNAF